jgi:hypothetical protein
MKAFNESMHSSEDLLLATSGTENITKAQHFKIFSKKYQTKYYRATTLPTIPQNMFNE